MFPFPCAFGGWWFLVMLGFFVFMMLACFLFRRVFHGGGFCCAGGIGRRSTASDDAMEILKARFAKGEIEREEFERMGREIREADRQGGR